MQYGVWSYAQGAVTTSSGKDHPIARARAIAWVTVKTSNLSGAGAGCRLAWATAQNGRAKGF